MKSCFLEDVASLEEALSALRQLLPGQESPWLLRTSKGDPAAYFNLVTTGGDVDGPAIQADVSGRHWDQMELVLATLEKLRSLIGGRITSDE